MSAPAVPSPEREYVAFRDPEDQGVRYVFDVSFLLSDYACIYGRGCRGVREDGPDEVVGCCVHGAYLVDDDDLVLVQHAVSLLDPANVELADDVFVEGWLELDDEGERKTRTVDGACVFLNRTAEDGRRTGCVLHHLADDRDEHHMTHKPWVCWQLPVHRAIEEQTANDGGTLEVHTIGPWERGSWGDGGADFGWWCMEDPAAFGHGEPVYASMEFELRAMVGDAVYDALRAHLASRARQRNAPRLLPVIP